MRRYGFLLLEYNPNLWIFKLDWRQKYPFFRNFRQKSYLRQIFHHNFIKKTFIPLFPLSPKNKLLPALKYDLEAFQKSCPPRCQICHRNPLKNSDVSKMDISEISVSNFVFLVSHCNVPLGSLCKI